MRGSRGERARCRDDGLSARDDKLASSESAEGGARVGDGCRQRGKAWEGHLEKKRMELSMRIAPKSWESLEIAGDREFLGTSLFRW